MEENRGDFLQALDAVFPVKEQDIRTYSPLTLAYLGDAVYELLIRSMIIREGNRSTDSLHRTVTKLVKAETQSALYYAVIDLLTEEEAEMLRKGKNSKPATKAKHAGMADYHRATGLETLFGYLYLQGRIDRAAELLAAGLAKLEQEQQQK